MPLPFYNPDLSGVLHRTVVVSFTFGDYKLEKMAKITKKAYIVKKALDSQKVKLKPNPDFLIKI